MAELLETVMLVCFGMSWPVSLVKNIRSRSAKGMSLTFILLILLGYLAGIGAKLIDGNISYVLLAYFWNLALVSVNLAVYFINRRHDCRAA